MILTVLISYAHFFSSSNFGPTRSYELRHTGSNSARPSPYAFSPSVFVTSLLPQSLFLLITLAETWCPLGSLHYSLPSIFLVQFLSALRHAYQPAHLRLFITFYVICLLDLHPSLLRACCQLYSPLRQDSNRQYSWFGSRTSSDTSILSAINLITRHGSIAITVTTSVLLPQLRPRPLPLTLSSPPHNYASPNPSLPTKLALQIVKRHSFFQFSSPDRLDHLL